MSNTQKANVLKIICLGNVATGKTCIIRRYVNNEFSHQYKTTIGVDFMLKDVNINGKAIKVQFWDLAGQERFSGLTRAYYRASVGAVVVFDLTSRATFDTVLNWKRDVESKITLPNGEKLPILLLGNKSDLLEGPDAMQQCASDEYIRQVAEEHGFYGYYKVSALSGANLHHAITELTHEIVRRLSKNKDGDDSSSAGANATASGGDNNTIPPSNKQPSKAQTVSIHQEPEQGGGASGGGCC